MKERFWKAYFYLMWFIFLFGLFAYQDMHDGWFTEFLVFDRTCGFASVGGCSSDTWALLTMFSVIPLAVIRWIYTGKHFWNKP